jgi:hypothetical protein
MKLKRLQNSTLKFIMQSAKSTWSKYYLDKYLFSKRRSFSNQPFTSGEIGREYIPSTLSASGTIATQVIARSESKLLTNFVSIAIAFGPLRNKKVRNDLKKNSRNFLLN